MRESPAIGASIFDLLCAQDSKGKLGDDETTTNNLFIDGVIVTEVVGRVAVGEEDGAEVE